MISQFWNINKKRQNISYSKYDFTIRKNNICHLVFLLLSLCFKDYFIQILVLMSYTCLKPHTEILQCSPYHCFWYCCDFMTNKIFQFVSLLQLTFKDIPKRNNHKVIDLVSKPAMGCHQLVRWVSITNI